MTTPSEPSKPPRKEPAVRIIGVEFGEVPAVETVEHDSLCRRYAFGGLAQLLRLGRLEEPDLHGRSFLRGRPKAIDRKFVYVWKADDAKGHGLELLYELWFEEGKFQYVPLKGTDKGRPTGDFHASLLLVLGTVQKPTHWYFFLLSPVRYSREALDRIAPEVPARGMRFPDPFWSDLLLVTDAHRGPRPAGKRRGVTPWSAAEPYDFRRARGPIEKGARIVGAQLYLIDPLAEAAEKARSYGRALNDWYAEIARLNADGQYTLAKRIAAVVAGQPKLANEVKQKELDDFIGTSEATLEVRERLVHEACRSLVDWIGVESRFEAKGRVVDAGASGVEVTAPPPASEARFNTFSQMVRDFSGAAEVPEPIEAALTAVYERLAECTPGRLWMRHIWEAKASGKALVADGGLSVLFEARRRPPAPTGAPGAVPVASHGAAGAADSGRRADDAREAARKTGAVVGSAIGVLCEKFAPLWDEAHARDLFRQFGIELEPIPFSVTGPRRAAAASQLAGEARAVLAEANVGVRLRPVASTAVERLGRLAPFLQLALELNNTARAVSAIGSGKVDAMQAVGLAGNVADSLQAASELARLARPGVVGFARAVPILGIMGGGMDTVSGATEATKAWEENGWSGRTVGHGLRTTGGALAIVGGVLLLVNPIGMAGALITLTAVGAQFAGSWIVEASSELRGALAESPWGKRTASLSPDLRAAFAQQHATLSHAVYPFTARVYAASAARFGGSFRRILLRVEVKEEVARWLPPQARWIVDANGHFGNDRTWKGWAIPNRHVTRAQTAADQLVVEVEAPGIVIGSSDDVVRVNSATITLMPCQDERYQVVKRIVNDTFDPTPWIGQGSSDPAR
ncbi:MAG: hypothetical protein WCC48_17635 [Anaeromyxobacteraceae bacterium]